MDILTIAIYTTVVCAIGATYIEWKVRKLAKEIKRKSEIRYKLNRSKLQLIKHANL